MSANCVSLPVDQPRPPGGGFQFRGFGEMTLLVDKAKSALIFIQAMDREEGGTERRVRFHPEGAPETITNMGRGMRHEESMIPHLNPPPGVKFQPEGMGAGAAGDGNPTLEH